MATSVQSLTLRTRVLRASAWTFGGHLTGQLLRLVSNLIMTRLLVPEMFGVMALANVIMVGLQLFCDVGLSQSIVQSPRGNDPTYLNTVWTVQILRGVLIWLAALAIGLATGLLGMVQWLPAGTVYADPVLPHVITALSFNALIGGFASTRLATASRNLALGRVTGIEVASLAAALVFMIAWSRWDRSVWALVAGSLVSGMLRVWLSHAFVPGHGNTLHWDRESLREIVGFGKWIFVTSILGFLAANGDRLLLGGLTDSATLGLYAIAFLIVGALQEAFSKLAGNVAFPVFSAVVRERRVVLKQTYYRFRLAMDVTTLLITGVLFSAGHLLIRLLYDDRYLAAGHMLEILCICLFEVRFALASHCFMALGMPRLMVPNIAVRILSLFVVMPLAFRAWGMEGALWVIGATGLIALPVTLYQKVRCGIFDLKRELAVLPVLPLGYVAGSAGERLAWLAGWTR
jgi:O-antigen/teichoic acid export membrane protein